MLKSFVRYGIALAVVVGAFMILRNITVEYRHRESALYLNNQSVVDMAKAGFGSEMIVARIDEFKGLYSVSDSDLLALKKAGISDHVIAHLVKVADAQSESIRSDEAGDFVFAFFASFFAGIVVFFLLGLIPVPSRSDTKIVEA
jgi:hypothetical protein